VIWYQITGDDTNPPNFLLYILHAAQRALPNTSELPIRTLQNWDSTQGTLPAQQILDQFLNILGDLESPVFLLLDDVHFLLESEAVVFLLDRMVSLAPPNLHIYLSSRQPVKLPNQFRWQSQGEVLKFDQGFLAFEKEEINLLFREGYQYELTDQEVQDLFSATDGWPVALHVIWQSLRTGAVASIEDALADQDSTMEDLFAILIHEVLEQQPEDIHNFLRASSILQVMTPEACDAVRNKQDSAALLNYLQRQDLFVVDLGSGLLRYQHIFHNLLQQQIDPAQACRWHGAASVFYTNEQDLGSAIYHALQADQPERAARLLAEHGRQLLKSGQLDSLAGHLEELPPELYLTYPALLQHLGDLARLKSRYQESLGWYEQAEKIWRDQGETAEIGRVLRGQARVYLDTVNPSRASELLQQALRLSDRTEDREANARLYELLSENKLNAGKTAEAEEYRRQAEALRREGPAESELLYRVLLRTGKLQEAREKLVNRAQQEREQPVQTPRAHRETLLVLSLICAFQGEAEEAYTTALEGIRRGNQLDSPFVTAVGQMRKGHALMVKSGQQAFAQARKEFEKAVEISRALAVPRLRVEAYWGLCRVYGYQGDLDQAAELAERGIEIALDSGDEWIASLIRLTLGASYLQADRFDSAFSWLLEAQRGFQECSDPFGAAAARLWRCLAWHQQDKGDILAQELPVLLRSCRENRYDFLFTKPTLLGPLEKHRLIPLLITARDQGWEDTYARQLLAEVGLPGIIFHPGYQLRVYTLGKFQTWRGPDQITSSGWQRSKTRQLFQVFLTFRSQGLERELIFEYLWPEASPDQTKNRFKVALSTLYRVLEPDRAPGRDSAFIARDESLYYLRQESDLWLDIDQFLRSLETADQYLPDAPEQALPILEKALRLYQGEYLPDARYETWAAAEREHLSVLYLRAADKLCELYLEGGFPEKTVDLCQEIFAEDNCWERAYRHLMFAYAQLGDHGQVGRTYQRCVQILQDELDISPSPETITSYQSLTHGRS
jgi:ATP/maltotriose-dependent transcriptional regulator MalT/DNA-binding SARP family transcriptional activator